MIERFVSQPRLTEVDHADVGVPAARAYAVARHLDLGDAPLVHALFALRTLPARLFGRDEGPLGLCIDDITGAGSAFKLLADEPGRGFVVGAIGRFWQPDIVWAPVGRDRFADFAEPGWGRVAWSVAIAPRGDDACRVTVELRVDATSDEAWRALHGYFRLIGPFSCFIRNQMLHRIASTLGSADELERRLPLPGDELIIDAASDTMGIDLGATPAQIWPWLLQMGCRRAGWYSHDLLDNGGVRSATEIIPSLQSIAVGDVLPATPEGDDGFEVLRIEPERALVLGGVYDLARGQQTRFFGARPERHWQVTWAFVLRPLDATTTRLTVRARAAYAPAAVGVRLLWVVPVHHFMERAQLRNLKERVEGRAPRHHDGWRDVVSGVGGALGMLFDVATPFLRAVRSH